jgi:hypothetical protein
MPANMTIFKFPKYSCLWICNVDDAKVILSLIGDLNIVMLVTFNLMGGEEGEIVEDTFDKIEEQYLEN